MTRVYLSYLGFVAGLLAIVACLAMLAVVSPKIAAAPVICHAAIVLDRSGSVDSQDLTTMQAQIKNLFLVNQGIHDPNVELAFWSFSSTVNPAVNYDAPFHGFVPSDQTSSTFNSALASIITGGGTDYEQGLGYNGYVFGNQTMNTKDGIDQIINQADIIVMMTDGIPNTPGAGGDDNPTGQNPTAREAARQAVIKHRAANKIVVGGIIAGLYQKSLNYVINGDPNSTTDVFNFNTDYTGLTAQLKSIIQQKCSEIVPPPPSTAFSLTPTVTSANTVVSGTDGASFNYNVNNDSTEGPSTNTSWAIRQMLVDRGQSVSQLTSGQTNAPGGYDCNALKALVGGNSTCSEPPIASSSRVFNQGDTSLNPEAPAATTAVLDDNWPIGSRLCYVLVVNKPTNGAQPTARFGAACIVIGKRPLVQIHGGDLKVGRHFVTDGASTADPAVAKTSQATKSNGLTYGSWVEYGVTAPGVVDGLASLSGLEGGLDASFARSQANWSKLTFANTDNELGLFTADNTGMGTIPDAKRAILAGRAIVRNLAGVANINLSGAATASGLYQKDSGNLALDASTIEKGKTFIVYVPAGTVTITGNIDYVDGPYTDMNQIPQLVIIAKSIAIKPSVVHVNAWLIADDENSGNVSTCDDPATLTITVCNTQLRIDGPIMAQHLSLRRTSGAGPGNAAGDPAEILNLPADAYLWSQVAGSNDARAQTTFTTELPPYF